MGGGERFVLWATKFLLLFGLFISADACSHTTLEEQFDGIENCKIKNVFLDPLTNRPSGRYFIERKLRPCRIDEAAFYCVNDSFYGLPVDQIAIPYLGPFSVHAIYLKGSPASVEAVLRTKFKSNKKYGVLPTLIADPQRQGISIFYCDENSE
ncbi:hypothetical protein ACW9H6_28490 [Pseudomonas sp. SDO528_S397]